MESSILQVAGSLGVGALLGVVMFYAYRQDRKASEKRHLEAWKASEERMAKIIESDQKTRQEYTKVMTELVDFLKRANGKAVK